MNFRRFLRIYYLKIYYYFFKILFIFLFGILVFFYIHFSYLEIKIILSKILFYFSLEQLELFKLMFLKVLKDLILILPAIGYICFSTCLWLYLKIYILNFPSYFHDFLAFYFPNLIKDNKFLNFFNLNSLNLCWTVRGFKLILQDWFGFFVGVLFFYKNYEDWFFF